MDTKRGKSKAPRDLSPRKTEDVKDGDVATGQATGQRIHKPLVIVKEIGAATP